MFRAALLVGICALPSFSFAAEGKPTTAAEQMLIGGPEDQELGSRTGTWTVVSTLRLTPEAIPMVSTGIVAVRTMIGPYLQEVMEPAPGSRAPAFKRISYLTYFRVEGRWQYVSIDTRFPVGIMPAWSFEKEVDGKLTLEFAPLAFVGLGNEVEGRTTHSNFVITRDGPDHEFSRQYWTRADGKGLEWLAVEYEYTRKR